MEVPQEHDANQTKFINHLNVLTVDACPFGCSVLTGSGLSLHGCFVWLSKETAKENLQNCKAMGKTA